MTQTIQNSTVNWDTRIWRYFNVFRFLECIEKNYLYFPSANQFHDPFEGAIAIQHPDYKTDPRYEEYSYGENAFKELKRLTKISCWHEFEYENDAMWEIYASSKKGVAIYTTPEKIRRALSPFRLAPEHGIEEIHIGKMNYVDLTQTRLDVTMLERFYNKHITFKWEQDGVFVDITWANLIEGVIIGPYASKKEKDKIMKVCSANYLSDKIEISSLLYKPRYI